MPARRVEARLSEHLTRSVRSRATSLRPPIDPAAVRDRRDHVTATGGARCQAQPSCCRLMVSFQIFVIDEIRSPSKVMA
jgi:hypothetical protein